ncbi:MAG TPA: BON domain-containing protein [Myxococcales bacterium]|jgi:osmotically-inducible protein OsmY
MADGKDSLPPGIPPDVADMIRRARADQRAAAELKEAIGAAGMEIQDLVVTYSGGVVALTGKAATQAQRDGAADVVRRQEAVRQVSNGIIVVAR